MSDNNGTILVGELTLELGLLDAKVKEANKMLNSIGKNASSHVKKLTNTYNQLSKSIVDGAKAAKQAWETIPSGEGSVKLLRDVTAAYRELRMSQSE